MSKRVYISADYSENNGDRTVVNELHKWGSDYKHKVDYVDTASVVSGSISSDPDCRPCDLKKEFNAQINVSSAVIFVIGDKTASRTAGNSCKRNTAGMYCKCTPYKQNANGTKTCKVYITSYSAHSNDDIGYINDYSYLKHEFLQAQQKNKTIIILYNSLYNQPHWLPSYMKKYETIARPFWKRNHFRDIIGDYYLIKKELGY